jgi:hypothetical protein
MELANEARRRVTTTTTKTVFTITKTRPAVNFGLSTAVVTASCSVPKKQNHHDPICTITPTVGGIIALALSEAAPVATATIGIESSVKFRKLKNRSANVALLDKRKFIEDRHKRLAHLAKRAPDQSTITVTDTNTADYITVCRNNYRLCNATQS